LKEQEEKFEERATSKREREFPRLGLRESYGSIPNLVPEAVDYIVHNGFPEVATDELFRVLRFTFYAYVFFALTRAELATENNADAMSDFNAEVSSEGDSTGSPMVLDDELKMINLDDFLYFPTSNRVQVITQPEEVEPAGVGRCALSWSLARGSTW